MPVSMACGCLRMGWSSPTQLKEETERLEEEEGETRKKMKATREHTKKWEETRENRVRHLPCTLGLLTRF